MVKPATAPSSDRRANRRTPTLLDLWLTAFSKHQRHGVKHLSNILQEETDTAKGEQRGKREAKKSKKAKVIAAAPSQEAAAWQPTPASGKRK